MEIQVAPLPIPVSATGVPAKAGDVAATGSPAATVDAADTPLQLILDMQAAADEATARETEVNRLTTQLLALRLDPAADAEAIAELELRIDMARLRADQAEQALYASYDVFATAVASTEPEVESHRDFFLRIAAGIEQIKGSYVNPAQSAATNYTGWYQEYQLIASKIKDAIKPSEEKGKESYQVVNFGAIREELDTFLARYSQEVMGTFPTHEDAIRFLEDAGLIASNFPLMQTDEGWHIGYPNQLVAQVRDDMPAGTETWSNPKYQQWLSGKTSIEERFQGDSRLLLENFGNVNSRFSTINDVYSETIKAITDVDRLFIQGA